MKKTMNSDNVDPITESKKEKRKKDLDENWNWSSCMTASKKKRFLANISIRPIRMERSLFMAI